MNLVKDDDYKRKERKFFKKRPHLIDKIGQFKTQKMAELRSAIFWVLCPKQSLHCYSPK